jgi:hypothetical protein
VDNLDFVLKFVEELSEGTIGKFVITADHGNLVGERQWPVSTTKMYGHPWNVYAPELVKVPWFTADFDKRRETVSDSPKTVPGHSEEMITDRLRALGYQTD